MSTWNSPWLSARFSLAAWRGSPWQTSRGWNPRYLFLAGQQGAWYDPSDLSTLFQDSTGTTPVTADGDPVGLMLDKSQGLSLGDELKSQGVTGEQGTTTPATYNTVTGEGSVHRDDVNNQSAVNFTGLTEGAKYRVDIENTDPSASIFIRLALNGAGSIRYSVNPGERVVALLATDALGTFSIATNGGTTTFTLYSFRELPGNHASQSTATSRPVYRTDGTLHWLEFDGVDDFIGSAFTQAIGYSRVSGVNVINLTDDSYIFSGNTTRSTFYKRTGTATNVLTVYNGTNGPESVAPNLLVASEEYLTGLDKLYFNQVLESTADAGDDTGTGVYVGGNSGGANNSQILFYGVVQFADPTGTKRQNVEKYMAEKAGVTL